MKTWTDPETDLLNEIHEMMIIYPFNCLNCKHFDRSTGYTCKAFPVIIPEPIKGGQVIHRKRLYLQENDIFFEMHKML